MAISRVCSLTDDHSVSRRVRRAPHAHGASSRDSRDVRGFRAWRVRLLCEAHETDHRGRPEPFPWKGIWLGLRIGRAIDGLDPDAIADAYWALHAQRRSAWTHELDLRPYCETW